MNRLQSELRRLYLPPAAAAGEESGAALIDDQQQVRALVLELARPASWEVLGRLWRGVQAELALPAPAIAVSGGVGLQLWFSLAEPIAIAQAQSFLQALCQRFLPEVAAARLSLWPTEAPPRHAAPVPAAQAQADQWSAFVAADLAPIFADTPWLDIPPGDEGQAELLAGLKSISPAIFEAAWAQLAPPRAPTALPADTPTAPASTSTSTSTSASASTSTSASASGPRSFLRQVMNDASAPLALRIEAAKALLPYEPT